MLDESAEKVADTPLFTGRLEEALSSGTTDNTKSPQYLYKLCMVL
jgi:hypothetical protein